MNLKIRRWATVPAAVIVTVAMAGSPAQGAQGDILHANAPQSIKDSYLVVLRDVQVAASDVGSVSQQLVAKHGGAVGFTYTAALRGFSVKVGEPGARRMAADARVAYVEQDQVVHALGTQSPVPSWGLDRIDQRNLPLDNSYTYPNTASNVRSYIIDTGIRITHNDFGGRASWGTNTTGDGNNTDCNGHGTHVAGTVGGTAYGVAKQTLLIAVKVLNCQGSGTTAGVVAGINWVTNNHVKPAVANMSLGGGVSTSLDDAVNSSINAGIAYAVAAGNDNANACNYSPARVAAAITVGSTTNTDARSSFSNIGTCVNIFAPGSSITSAWSTSDTATNTISGTSMASPHAAGAAALVASANPSWTPSQVANFLYTNATTGVISNPGSGSPNRLLFVVNDTPPPANDFSISVSPASGSTAQGGSVSATVSTTLVSGSAETVSMSASGLPSGATALFSPSSVTTGGSSTMTISTSGSTPTGTYSVTITGTAPSATRTTTYSLTVTGTGGCSSPGQKLVNPGFESGSTGWTADSGVIGQWGSYGQPPRSGTWNAWHNGYGASNTDYAWQQVSLPSGCTSYTLSFWLHIDTAESTTAIAYDTFRVQVLNTSGTVLATLATYSNLNAAPGYVQKTLSLNAWAGQTIRIRWFGQEDWIYQTSFVIDDTALNVS